MLGNTGVTIHWNQKTLLKIFMTSFMLHTLDHFHVDSPGAWNVLFLHTLASPTPSPFWDSVSF